ncbi:MAG: threonine synthase [Pseudomonadota bacterium]
MRYRSTRGAAAALSFEEVTLAGLAPDGGLYVPEHWPVLTPDEIGALAGLDYVETCARVCAPFVAGSLSEDELRTMARAAYGGFAHEAVTPLVQLDGQHWLLELFHGPTLAFKDVALQLLGQMFARFLRGRDRPLTIIGATSGDTGSAAIHAVAGLEAAEIFMAHPAGRISDVQRRQMTTVDAPNVHNVAIAGSFDDAQRHVKRMFGDPALTDRFDFGAVNSINWARLMAQVVYYFYAAVRLGAPDRKVAFSVPTGNFGDVFAGYVAAKMGLPVERLIVATNVNDILHRALSADDYSVGEVTPTAAPSMDIQVSSNFERLLYDLDPAGLARRMAGFEADGKLDMAGLGERGLFASARVDEPAMQGAMREALAGAGQLIDPHTAIGLAAAREVALPADVPVVTLATAHPAKFGAAVHAATGRDPDLPARLGSLMTDEEHYERIGGDYEAFRNHVAAHGNA